MTPAATLEASEPPHCLNCATALHGPFCAHCGQEHRPGAMPIREYLTDALDAFFDWDGKVLRSLWPLLARPGFLTREFLAGRRVPYLLPSRLYFLVSIAFFFLVNHFDPVTISGLGGREELYPELSAQINRAIPDFLPVFMLGAVPAFAFGLWLLHLRSRRYFTEHLAFSFHLFAFVFLAFTLPVLGQSDALWNVSFLAVLAYLVLSLRRVYPQPLPKVLGKGVLLYAYFWVLLVLYLVFVLVAAAVRAGLEG